MNGYNFFTNDTTTINIKSIIQSIETRKYGKHLQIPTKKTPDETIKRFSMNVSYQVTGNHLYLFNNDKFIEENFGYGATMINSDNLPKQYTKLKKEDEYEISIRQVKMFEPEIKTQRVMEDEEKSKVASLSEVTFGLNCEFIHIKENDVEIIDNVSLHILQNGTYYFKGTKEDDNRITILKGYVEELHAMSDPNLSETRVGKLFSGIRSI